MPLPFDVLSNLNKNRKTNRRAKQTEKAEISAIIGNEQNKIYVPGWNGNLVYVRLLGDTENGNATYQPSTTAFIRGSFFEYAGSPVIVKYNNDGNLYVAGADESQIAQAGQALSFAALNPGSKQNKFLNLDNVLRLMSRPFGYGSAGAGGLTVGVAQFIYDHYGSYVEYNGTPDDASKIDLSSYVPTAGNHLIAQLWLDTFNNTIQVTTSTSQAITTDFDSTDFTEAWAGSTRFQDWLPLQSYELKNNETILTHKNLNRDNRQYINLPDMVGLETTLSINTRVRTNREYFVNDLTVPAGYQMVIEAGGKLILNNKTPAKKNNYTAMVAPTVNDDINKGYQIGSLWLNNTDTNYYICNDATLGAAHWERILTSLSIFVSTGIIDGGAITQNVGTPTTIDIAAGSGIIVDKSTTPEDPVTTHVDWTAKTAVVFDNTGVFDDSYIAIDSNGDVVQRSVPFTIDETRQYVVLGFVSHPIANSNNVQSISTYGANSIGSIGDGTQDILTFIGGISKYDNPIVYSAATGIYAATLRIAHSAGDILQLGVNYDGNNRHNIHSAAAIDPDVFYYRWINASVVPAGLGSVIVPGTWDDGTGTNVSPPTGSVNPNQWTVQRIFYRAGTAETFIHYGQNVYATKNAALEAIFQGTDTFTIDPELRRTGALLRSFMAVRGGATATDDTGDVVFIEADQFGVGALGVNLTVVQSLQNVYDNSGQPEIIIDSTRSTINIRNATSDTETDLMDFYSNDGVTKYGAIGKNGLSLNAGATVNNIVNSVTGIDATSTDTQLATAKAVYDAIKDHPTDSYIANEVSDYITTSTSFVDVDTTNLSLTITTTGGDVLIGFTGNITATATNFISLDVHESVAAARIGGDDGMTVAYGASDTIHPVTLCWLATGLASGSHTFKLQWKVSGGTGTIYAGAGTGNADVHPQFWVREI